MEDTTLDTMLDKEEVVPEPIKQKYVAVVLDENNNMTFSIEGLTMDECLIAITKGAIKFRKVYEANIVGE